MQDCGISSANTLEIHQSCTKPSMYVFPHFQGLGALHSPITGIVDYGLVARSYGTNFQAMGGTVHTGFKVKAFEESADCPEYPVTIVANNSVSLRNQCRMYIISYIRHMVFFFF